MGAITFSLDENLAAFLANQLPISLFIETGAFHGDSLELARRHFRECRSCEMSPELHEQVRARFAGQSNVKVQLSDSPPFHLADLQHLLLQALVFGNVSANRNILLRFPIGIQIRINGCCDPVKLPVLGTIADCPLPDAAS